ncbi:hypothetical protein EDB85DRAFT_1891223 [Lactarius pseudohatsudake]|nr:hypothetical protein EDB85DRAFT_1891223 [Lactarius pseudohatsudake]
MPKQPSSPLIHARGGRMSNRPYIPSPSPPVEDFKIKWSYDEDTRLVLHDIDECKTCETWSMHHFVHTTHGNDTLQKAEAARDSLRREMEEWRQELAALRREFQEIRQELKDAVGTYTSRLHTLSYLIRGGSVAFRMTFPQQPDLTGLFPHILSGEEMKDRNNALRRHILFTFGAGDKQGK